MVTPDADAWRRLGLRARGLTVRQAARLGPWLVLAPHPDDESLGAGAFAATLAAAGAAPLVAFLTDGGASHVGAPGWSAARLAVAREAEAARALAALGIGSRPLHLRWPDAAPPAPGTIRFEATARRLAAACRRAGIRAIAATWAGEPHCDHEAAAALARAAARRRGIAVYDYIVWGWTLPDPTHSLRRRRAIRIPVARGRPAARRALACHASQVGTRIAGADAPFRLPRAMARLVDRPAMLLLEGRDDAA